jgi:myo-inositol-1(or 4)-monophosphatase
MRGSIADHLRLRRHEATLAPLFALFTINREFTMQPMLNIAVRAARQAGDVIMRRIDRLDTLKVTSKSRNDFVSDIDRKAEEVIIETIRAAYPEHAILAEESGSQTGNDFEWVIDPLDGTTNYLHGYPQFSVSIALREKGRLSQAVVYDPVRQDLFTASRGSGAQLNNRRLRVSAAKGLEGALLGTGFPFRQPQHMDVWLGMFRELFPQVSDIRRSGSAALELAYVAAGQLDGFWEIGLSEWDMAAGALLIQEAGGLVSDFDGGHNYMQSGNIVAGNPRVFKAMLSAIHPHVTAKLGR